MDPKMMPIILAVMIIAIAGIVFAWQGVRLQGQVAGEEARFHQLQNAYFRVSKTERDAAPTGSELNKQLAAIQNFPSELLRLKLVGVGKILTGIFLVLFDIAIFLFMMPIRLAAIMKKSHEG